MKTQMSTRRKQSIYQHFIKKMTNIYFLTSVKDNNKIDSCNQNHIQNQDTEREKPVR